MAIDEALYAWVHEALAPLGTVTKRAMMGGATLYLDGIVFAILDEGEVWLKADAHSDAIWDEVGAARFSYDMGGKIKTMNYRRGPTDVYDDADAMREWAALAVEAGRRGAAKKRPRKRAAAEA